MKVAIESSVHRHEPINSGPVHTYSGFRQHASGEFDSESGYFKVRSPEWKKKKKIRNDPITCGRVNPDIFQSDDAKSCPVSYRKINQYGSTRCRSSFSMAHAPKAFYYRGVLGNQDESGNHRMFVDRRIRSEYTNVWTGKFFNPERKSCGFKSIRIRVDGALEKIGHARLRELQRRKLWQDAGYGIQDMYRREMERHVTKRRNQNLRHLFNIRRIRKFLSMECTKL